MVIDTMPPEGSNYTQEQWEIVVERMDRFLNRTHRERLSPSTRDEPTAQNQEVYHLVTDENGVTKMEPVLKAGDSPDKYTQTKRILDAKRKNERLFYRGFGAPEPRELHLTGDPPQPSDSELLPYNPGDPPVKPTDEFIPDPPPPKPEELPRPSFFGIKSILNSLFGWFETQLAPYRANQEVQRDYARRLEEHNDKQSDKRMNHPAKIAAYPKALEKYLPLKEAYDAAFEKKQQLEPYFQPYREQWAAKSAVEEKVNATPEENILIGLERSIYNQKETERRFNDALGAKPNIKQNVLNGLEEARLKKLREDPEFKGKPLEMPEYPRPDGVTDDQWCAMTLGAIAEPGVMMDISDSSTEMDLKGTKEQNEEIDRFNKTLKVTSNLLLAEDHRMNSYYIGIQRGRERANEAWQDYARGDPEKAAQMLGKGLTYYTQMGRADPSPDNTETLAACYGIKLMVDCVDKHPKLGKYVDENIMREARGYVKLHDEMKKTTEAVVTILKNPPTDEKTRREMISDILVDCALLQSIRLQKSEIKKGSKAFLEADRAGDDYKKICSIKEFPPEKLSMQMADPNMVPKVKASILENVSQTDYYKKIMELPQDKLLKEFNSMYNIMQNTRTALSKLAEEKQKQRELEKQKTQQVVKTTEVKVQEEKPPVLNGP